MSIHVEAPSLKAPNQYRRLAREAIRRAKSAPSAYFRLSYLSLAAGWRALADRTESAQENCPPPDFHALHDFWPATRAN